MDRSGSVTLAAAFPPALDGRTFMKLWLPFLLVLLLGGFLRADEAQPTPTPPLPSPAVYVIPIRDVIDVPVGFIVKRALKEASERGVPTVVLDINTPGGRGDIMEDIIDDLGRFEGTTIAYVNSDALSAGALISAACTHIYYAPKARVGAAAPILGDGQDIPETLTLKIVSALQAKVRANTTGDPRRAEVIKAMMLKDFEFKIGETVIKPKSELLTLTATEALKTYGDPATPLFGTGIAKDMTVLLDTHLGPKKWVISSFEVTWSEKFAQWVHPFIPMIFGLGMLALLIEFKTPGFGVLGAVGIGLLALGFGLNHVAGLAGWEPAIFLLLGVGLLAVELFVFPGTFVAGVIGLVCILGSLLWSMADIWPAAPALPGVSPGDSPAFDWSVFSGPLNSLGLALLITGLGLVVAWRFLPHTPFFRHLVLSGHSGQGETPATVSSLPAIGDEGETLSELRPGGEALIGGRSFEVRSRFGIVSRGTRVRVVDHDGPILIVTSV